MAGIRLKVLVVKSHIWYTDQSDVRILLNPQGTIMYHKSSGSGSGNVDSKMKALARSISSAQGGTHGSSESLDKNRGSDKGGSNAPNKKNG